MRWFEHHQTFQLRDQHVEKLVRGPRTFSNFAFALVLCALVRP